MHFIHHSILVIFIFLYGLAHIILANGGKYRYDMLEQYQILPIRQEGRRIMSKIAFLFSGQGAQQVGMGRDLYEHSPAVRALYDRAEVCRPGTLSLMFEGDEAALQQTENTQPCLYLADLGAALALREAGVVPEAVAGFSLGELAALAFGGACDGLTGFRLACQRGLYMAEASRGMALGMAAIVKLPDETVEALCARHPGVYPVNYNCDSQLAVAGELAALEPFYEAVRAAGGRSMPLKVSGAFHSPYMDRAASSFGAYLEQFELKQPALPVYANCTAEPYGRDVAATLSRQINHPVRWKTILRRLEAQGFDTFIECGPGSVLRRLTQKNLDACTACSVEDMAGVARLKELGL